MTTIFYVNLTDILNKELVGKSYRYCTYRKDIMQPYTVFARKQGATLKQFQDNPQRFGYSLVREKKIGEHAKYEESIIKRVWLIDGDYDSGFDIKAELENGEVVYLSIS